LAANAARVANRGKSPFNRLERHDAKYTAILSHAARLFNSKGTRATTLTDIAASLGLTKTSLYYYVKTKEVLIYQCYMATLESHHATLDDIEARYQAPLDRVAAFFLNHFDCWLAARQGRGSYRAALLEIASLKGAHREEVEAAYMAVFKRVRQYLRDGIAEGTVRNCETTSTTRALLASLPSWSLSWLHEVPTEDIPQVAQQTLDVLLNGLYSGEGSYSWQPINTPMVSAAQNKAFISREEGNRLKQEAFFRAGSAFFNRKGFKGTSLNEISEHLHVSKGAFYYHIRNKEDLLYQCYKYSLDITSGIQAQVAELEGSGIEKLDHVCRRIFMVQNSDVGPLVRYSTLTALSEAHRVEVIQLIRRYNQNFGDVIAAGVADGSIRGINNIVTRNLVAGAINASMGMSSWRRLDDLESDSAEYFNLLFNGLRPL
jgi:AcrR family transcriptional regulator